MLSVVGSLPDGQPLTSTNRAPKYEKCVSNCCTLRNPHLCFECFSLCVSRACLGKSIIFSIKWRKNTCVLFAPGLRSQDEGGPIGLTPKIIRDDDPTGCVDLLCVPQLQGRAGHRAVLRKTPLLFG